METKTGDKPKRSIANFAALKTSIAIGDEKTVKDLLPNEPMNEMEKSYLIELAQLNGHSGVLELLKGIPETK